MLYFDQATSGVMEVTEAATMMAEETEDSRGTAVTWTPGRSRGAALREEAAEAGGGEVIEAEGAEEEAAVEAGEEVEEGLLCPTS